MRDCPLGQVASHSRLSYAASHAWNTYSRISCVATHEYALLEFGTLLNTEFTINFNIFLDQIDELRV